MPERIRYRRTSLKTMLGITAEKKKIKRELGITALLRPFRWWGNEKRHVKRELGYYNPDVTLLRHELPGRSLGSIFSGLLLILLVPFVLGWALNSFLSQPANPNAPAGQQATEQESAQLQALEQQAEPATAENGRPAVR